MDRTAGTFVARYEILEELGRGSMGIVYKARDPQIDRMVAVKTIALLTGDAQEQQEYRQRFFLEARAAGRLSHPGIVTIFDVGEEPQAHSPFIVMEFIDGRPLNKFIASPAKLPLRRALRLAQQLAEALDYAHAQGVVHRDMKPANILVTKDGHAKITDFGIAKLNVAHITHAGHVVGTPAYMSPEQLEGEEVDGRSDLFSLGVILYTMLTGHRPFQGNSAATVSFKVANRDPLPASAFDSALPPELDYIIARAMAKDRNARYQTGREMALDLHSLLRGQAPRSQGDQAPKHAQAVAVPASDSTQRMSGSRPLPVPFNPRQLAEQLLTLSHTSARRTVLAVAVLLVAGIVSTQARRLHSSSASTSAASPTAASIAAPTAAPEPAPVAEAKPMANPASPKPVPRSSTLQLQVEHHLAAATLRIWSDGHLIYTHALHGEAKKHLVVFKKVEGSDADIVHLLAGKHHLRVQVEADGYDQFNTIVANLSHVQPQTLQIRCDKEKLDLTLQ
jgi:serine/threonine-protein kinase